MSASGQDPISSIEAAGGLASGLDDCVLPDTIQPPSSCSWNWEASDDVTINANGQPGNAYTTEFCWWLRNKTNCRWCWRFTYRFPGLFGKCWKR